MFEWDDEENRKNIKNKLALYYIPEEFQQMLNLELVKHNTSEACITFPIDSKSWEVFTTIPISYSYLGFALHNEEEKIVAVEIKGRFNLNGVPTGPEMTVKFSNTLGFYNLDECVKEVLRKKNTNEYFASRKESNDFSISRILETDYEVAKSVTKEDYRVIMITKYLVDMGWKQKRASDTAFQKVSEKPYIEDIDKLIDEIISNTK